MMGQEISYKVILARPRNPDNIGAAARAMANFGLNELALVAPHIPVWRETAGNSANAGSGEPVWMMERARAAVGAVDLIKTAKVYDTPAEAASDCALLLGTSALQRRTLERDVILLENLRGYIAERQPAGETIKVGLLFGSERHGLTNEEMSYCHALLNIPTLENQPSMNLGQAVALVCYEAAGRGLAVEPRVKRPGDSPPAIKEIEAVIERISGVISVGDYAKEIRRGLLDARLSKGAMIILKKILTLAERNSAV